MPGKIVKRTLTDSAEVLKMNGKNNQSMVLFLGSRAGSLFRSTNFYSMLEQYSTRNFKLLSHEEQFAECYRILQTGRFDESALDTILKLSLRDMIVIDASICLAEFIKQDLFDIIVSTNIDTCLEDALKEIGIKEYQFGVFIPEHTALHDIIYSDKKCLTRIIKIFGDLPSRVYNIVNRDFYLEHVQELKDYLEGILSRDVLIIGFDPVWDGEMLRVFPLEGKTCWLISEEEVSVRHPLVRQALNGREIKCITGKVGSYEQSLKALYWQLTEGMPIKNYERLIKDLIRHLTINHVEDKAKYKESLNVLNMANETDNEHQPKGTNIPSKPLKIIFCYARKDEKLQKELSNHLSPLKRIYHIDNWFDQKIDLGSNWKDEITDHLDAAHIILLLISSDFIASHFCYDIEMQKAIEKHERGEACVIPIILRQTHWQDTPLGKLQALPRNGRPVTDRRWGRADNAYNQVVGEIKEIIERYHKKYC